MSSTSNSSNRASSGNNRKSSSRGSSGSDEAPIEMPIERRSPTKMRLPSNKWIKVGQRSQGEPAFDIESQVDFPSLPPSPRAPSPTVSSDDDHGDHHVFSASVQDALR